MRGINLRALRAAFPIVALDHDHLPAFASLHYRGLLPGREFASNTIHLNDFSAVLYKDYELTQQEFADVVVQRRLPQSGMGPLFVQLGNVSPCRMPSQ